MTRDKSSIVLLRGLGREARHWGGFSRELSEATHREVIAVDLPGVGQFVKTSAPSTIEEMAQFVESHLPPTRPLVIVAVSLGAMVAQQLLANRPDQFHKVILINTSTKDSGHFLERLRWPGLVGLTAAFSKSKLKEREAQILATVANSEALRNEMLSLWTQLAMEKKVPARSIFQQLRAAAQFKAPDLSVSKQKLLLIQSLGDRLVDPVCTEVLSQKWGCELVAHPWAGHDLAIDDPKWLIHHISRSI